MTLWDTYAQLLNSRKFNPHYEHIGSDVSGKNEYSNQYYHKITYNFILRLLSIFKSSNS